MASTNFRTKDSVFDINTYTIDTNYRNIIGKGAFGIVYKATDNENKEIAAKTIDGKQHPRILSQDLNKLLDLRHENIVNILCFHQQEETLWMFMQLCCHGDLNMFFRKRTLNFDQKLEIMQGIARGIHYLHERNIIHRDIKPGNILIACDSPLIPKLTDFDLSKSLDPDFETSVMSSNVGTLAFKAPEFFNRMDEKLEYHRNVDIYSGGLTFLAMAQAKEECRKLIPRIETPRDNSERHVQSIGQLIAERIKYDVPDLNIVLIGKSPQEGDAHTCDPQETEVKKLIQKMTCVEAKKRLSAAQVVLTLEQIIENQQTTTSNSKPQQREGNKGSSKQSNHNYPTPTTSERSSLWSLSDLRAWSSPEAESPESQPWSSSDTLVESDQYYLTSSPQSPNWSVESQPWSSPMQTSPWSSPDQSPQGSPSDQAGSWSSPEQSQPWSPPDQTPPWSPSEYSPPWSPQDQDQDQDQSPPWSSQDQGTGQSPPWSPEDQDQGQSPPWSPPEQSPPWFSPMQSPPGSPSEHSPPCSLTDQSTSWSPAMQSPLPPPVEQSPPWSPPEQPPPWFSPMQSPPGSPSDLSPPQSPELSIP